MWWNRHSHWGYGWGANFYTPTYFVPTYYPVVPTYPVYWYGW